MPTNRRPPTRPPKRIITPRAIALFRRLAVLEEQEEYWNCSEYWDHHSALVFELRLRPWESPMEDDKIYSALQAASDDRKSQ
jgi:hypothetical protein